MLFSARLSTFRDKVVMATWWLVYASPSDEGLLSWGINASSQDTARHSRERFQTTRDQDMYRSTTQRRHHDAGSYWIMNFLPDMESKDRKHQQGRCLSCKGGATAAFAYLLHEVMCRGLPRVLHHGAMQCTCLNG